MASTVYNDLIPVSEIIKLKDYYDLQPHVNTEDGIKNKFLEYHIHEDISYKILNPIIESILPGHAFDTGTVKYSNAPYPLHVDSYDQHDQLGVELSLDGSSKFIEYSLALIIPLVEDENLKTITFDIFSDFNVYNLSDYVQDKNNDLLDIDISHDLRARKLKVDKVFTWKLGDVFAWPRNQVHMSNNFVKYGLTKKFMILFFK